MLRSSSCAVFGLLAAPPTQPTANASGRIPRRPDLHNATASSQQGPFVKQAANYEPGQGRIDVLELLRIVEALGADARAVFMEIARRAGGRGRAEDKNSPVPIRVKVETATRERTAYLGAQTMRFGVNNPWFTGAADIATFSKEEILATKLRALLQRDKGRDLLDLAYATVEFEGLDYATVVECFGKYLKAAKQSISRAEAEQRMFAKLDDPSFLADVRPLLSADEAEKFDDDAANAAFSLVFTEFIKRIPGHAWADTPAMAEKYAMPELAEN
jgi:hypothetical protein